MTSGSELPEIRTVFQPGIHLSASPVLEKGIGMGYVCSEFDENGLQIETGDGKRQVKCRIVSKKYLANTVKEKVRSNSSM